MKSENTFPFVPPFRWVRRSAVVLLGTLLVLLLHAPLRAGAQGCPSLDTGDFTATLIAANSDCHTPARLTVTYRNAVAGFSAMAYSVSKNRTNYSTPVVTPRPGLPAVLPLDGWNEGEPIYIRAVATCGTRQLTVVLPKIVYHVKEAADVQATATITPAGGCEATGGAVSVHLSGVSGFSKAEFKLEKDGATPRHPSVPVGNLTARKPYEETLFFNLAPGRYTLRVRAVPDCVPATPGEGWKDGAYEWEQPVDVEHFGVTATTIPTRGNCPGGVVIGASKVVGIARLKYELWKKGGMRAGTPPLQTANVVYPAFAHTFTGLPLGDYEVRATATDCDATATGSFVITQGELVHPKVSIIRHTYAGCAAGRLQVQLDGTTAACPASYRLTPTAGGTPKVLTDVATETAEFSGLAAGTYTLTTTYGGQTINTPVEIKTVSPGVLKIKPTLAETYCSPTGAMEVTLVDGTLDESATLELSLDGNPVRSINLNAGETSKTIEGLLPGGYNVTLRTECGAKVSTQTAIGTKNAPNFSFIPYGDGTIDYCQSPLTVKLPLALSIETSTGGIDDPDLYKSMITSLFTGATYEIHDFKNKLISSGTMPVEQMLKGIDAGNGPLFSLQLPLLEGTLRFSVRMPCGTPTIHSIYPLEEFRSRHTGDTTSVVKFPLKFDAYQRDCDQYSISFEQRSESERPAMHVRIVNAKTKATVAEQSSTEGSYRTAEFEEIPSGEYFYEFWSDCPNAVHHRSANFKLGGGKNEPSISVTKADGCKNTGSINVTYYVNTTTCKYTLRRADGSLVEEITNNNGYMRFNNLAPGKYKLAVVPTPKAEDCPVEGVTEDIEILGTTNYSTWLYPPNYSPNIQNAKATLGAIQTNSNTLSFDFYSTPGQHTLKLVPVPGTPIVKTVSIPDNGNLRNSVPVKFENLPDSVTLHFPGEDCGVADQRSYNLVEMATGKVHRPEFYNSLHVTVRSHIPGCQQGQTKLHSDLLEKGLPQRPTALVIREMGAADFVTVDSITSPNIITDWTAEDPTPRMRQFVYYYDGRRVAEAMVNETVFGSPFLAVQVQPLPTPPGEKGIIEIKNFFAGPTDHLRLKITDSRSGRELFDETLVGSDTKAFAVPPGPYTVHYEALDGCYAGQEREEEVNVSVGEFKIKAKGNRMNCANDGVITVEPEKGFATADQINYEITPNGGGSPFYAQTTTPQIPKEFPGLQAGSYTIKATAIVLRGFDGQPHSYEASAWASLSTQYTALSVRNAPENSTPASECGTGGAIGLVIGGNRSNEARVFITDTPTGALSPRQEIAQNANGSWGKDLAPGTYKLFVTDGCTDIVVPTATVSNVDNKALVKNLDCVKINVLSLNSDKLIFTTALNLQAYPERERDKLIKNFEVQIVAPGANPEDGQWSPYANSVALYNAPYNYLITSERARFDVNNGYDILYRFKGCPASMKRFHQAKGTFKICDPFIVSSESSEDCKFSQFTFNTYDTEHPYRVVFTNLTTGQVIYDQVRTFPYDKTYIDHNHRQKEIKESIFRVPSGGEYKLTITSLQDPIPQTKIEILKGLPPERKFFIDSWSEQNTSCLSSSYRISWYSGTDQCKYFDSVRVFDKVTGVEQHHYYIESHTRGDIREYLLNRNRTYIIKGYENGVHLDSKEFTPEYDLPKNYLYEDIKLTEKCEPNAPKEAQGQLSYIFVDWATNDQKRNKFDHKLKVILRDNVNHRIYESHNIDTYVYDRPSTGQSAPTLYIRSWNELNAAGDTISRGASPSLPPGNHSLEVYTSCGDVIKSTFNVIYMPPVVTDVKISDIKHACDGKITFTPTGTAAFPDRADPATITSYYDADDKYTTYNWGDPMETYKPSGNIYYTIEFGDGSTCKRSLYYNLGLEPLAFDKSSTVSFFCSGADKGEINVGLKGGHPPYTYELRTLDGLLVEKKTAPGVVTFEQGVLGSRYRIEATDDCGLTHIHQDVLLQDPAAISGKISADLYFCEGDAVRLNTVSFPGATYTWTRPDGSQSHDKELTFPATAVNAGNYIVQIQLNSCNATLTGKYTVQVAQLAETTGSLKERTCAGQSAIFAPQLPTAKLDGKNIGAEYLTHQWQYTKTPNDETSWKPIFGATDASVEYVAAYPGTYYLRRTTQLGECSAIGGVCTLTVDPGITVTMSAGERRVVIDHKNPFLLTAGIVSGPAARTYQWQRSLDGKQWSNIAGATEVTYTETQRLSSVVYYRRIVRSGTCETKGEPITVVFKRRYPAMINPQVRQRVDQHW